jgi:hypothetical protein
MDLYSGTKALDCCDGSVLLMVLLNSETFADSLQRQLDTRRCTVVLLRKILEAALSSLLLATNRCPV